MKRSYIIFVAKFEYGIDKTFQTSTHAIKALRSEVSEIMEQLNATVTSGTVHIVEATPADMVYTALDRVVQEVVEQIS